MTVKQLIKGLKKYNPDLAVVQGDTIIPAMRIHNMTPDRAYAHIVVRLIEEGEKRA